MTDKEMWEQDIEFITKLREENEELKKKIDKALEYILIIDNRNTYVEVSELRHIEEILKD